MRLVTALRAALALASPRVSRRTRALRSGPPCSRLQRPRLALPLLRALTSGGQAAGTDCWRCGARAGSSGLPFFCPACGALQPPDESRDWFALLGSERSFRLDQARLQKAYKELQRLLHPDNFSRGAEAERDYSHGHSALVSAAYQTLSRPLSRGLYLLELEGVREGEGERVSAAFLAHVLELNERLAEARGQAEVGLVAEQLEAELGRLAESVAQAFDGGRLGEAGRLLSEMRYLSSIEDKVKEKLFPS